MALVPMLVLLLALATSACGQKPADNPPVETRHGAAFDPEAPRHVVPDAPSCPECAIELALEATLGGDGDPASVSPGAMSIPCAAGVLRSGEYVVSQLVGGGELAVYDAAGSFVRRIGRPGEGPGEFGRDLRLVVGRGDTVHVIDNGNQRITALVDGEPVGSFRTPSRVLGHALLDDGRFLVHDRASGRPGDDRSLFTLLAPDGEATKSFGEPHAGRTELGVDQWIVASGRGGGSWTASIWDYELYRWTGADSLDHTLLREPAWFPGDPELSAQTFERMHAEDPAPPIMIHAHEDDDGLLWTYALVPDADWRPAPPEQPTPAWTRRTFDTRIEVLDLASRRVVAATRHDHQLAPICGTGLVYTVIETPTGDTRLRILRPRLSR